MNDIVRAVIGRIIGAAVGAAVGYLAGKGVTAIEPSTSQDLTRALTDAAMLAGYGIAHKLTNRRVNPDDTAKGY